MRGEDEGIKSTCTNFMMITKIWERVSIFMVENGKVVELIKGY